MLIKSQKPALLVLLLIAPYCFADLNYDAAAERAYAEKKVQDTRKAYADKDSDLADQMRKSNEKMRALKAKRAKQQYGGGPLNSMEPETKLAWKNWNSNNYPPTPQGAANKKRDFLILQRDWAQVQAEAHKGFISPDDNSKFLREHAADMKKRMQAAGKEFDLDVSLQTPSGPQKTYSDVDGHGRPTWTKKDGSPGDMTVEQFIGARKSVNDTFKQDLLDAGLDPIDNISKASRTDLMPVTDDTDLFQSVEAVINPDGGVMYQDRKAVDQELKNRQFDADGKSLGEATDADTKAAYLQEQIRQQRSHAVENRELLDEGNRLIKDPKSKPEQVREGLRKLEHSQGEGSSLIGKYEDRGNKIVNQMADKTGSDGIAVSEKRQAAIDAVGAKRDRTVTQQSADIVATTENAIKNQQVEGAKALVRDGELGAAAEVARNADANTRGEIIEQARNASRERWEKVVRESGYATDPEDVRKIAGKLADRDAHKLSQEMARNSKKDVLVHVKNDKQNYHRWEMNSQASDLKSDGMEILQNTSKADLLDKDLPGARRPQFVDTPNDVAVIGKGGAAKVTKIDNAGTPNRSALHAPDLPEVKGSSILGGSDLPDAKRPKFTETPTDVAVLGKGGNAKVTKIDNANIKPKSNLAGAAFAGVETGLQVGEATARKLGEVLDRDDQQVTAGDVAAVAGEAIGYTPVVEGIKATRQQNAMKEVELDVEINKLLHKKEPLTADEQARLNSLIEQANNADSVTATVSSMGQQMLVEPNKEILARRMQEMREQARAEGREAEFLRDGIPAMAKAGAEVIGNMTGMNTAASLEAEISTFDERSDWTAQRKAMVQYVNQNAIWADKRANAMVAQFENLLMNSDLSDPANRGRINGLLAGIQAQQDRINQLVGMAKSQLAEVPPEQIAVLMGIARSQRDIPSLRDWAQQMMASVPVKQPQGPAEETAKASDQSKQSGSSSDEGWGTDDSQSGWGESAGESGWGDGEYSESGEIQQQVEEVVDQEQLAQDDAAAAWDERQAIIDRARSMGEAQRYSDESRQADYQQRRAQSQAQLNALSNSLMGALGAATARQNSGGYSNSSGGSSYNPAANSATQTYLQQRSGGGSSSTTTATSNRRLSGSSNCQSMQNRVVSLNQRQQQLLSAMNRASSRSEQQRIGTQMEQVAREQSSLASVMMSKCASSIQNRTGISNQEVINRSRNYGRGTEVKSQVHEDATIFGQ